MYSSPFASSPRTRPIVATSPGPTTPRGYGVDMRGGVAFSSWSAGGSRANIFKKDGGSTSPRKIEYEDPSHCGIGIFFEKLTGPLAGPAIKDITPMGSADRDGTLQIGDLITEINGEDCIDWSMQKVRSACVGTAGTSVRFTAVRNDKTFELMLTRGSPEYWQFHDMIQRLKQELAKKSLEIEQLKMSVKDREDARSNNGHDAEAVKGLLAAEEEKRRTLMADLEREVLERKRCEGELTTTKNENKQLNEQVEGLMSKVSEIGLSTKSLQAMSKEMQEKARQSEQARQNEEQVRGMAESREAKAQALLIEEIQKRKQMENEVAVLSARLVEAQASASQADEMALGASGLRQEVLQLKSEVGVASGEADALKFFAKQCMEEGQAARLELSRVTSELALAKGNEADALGKMRGFQETLANEQSTRFDAGRELAEALQRSAQADTERRNMSGKLASVESTLEAANSELGDLRKQVSIARVEGRKASVALGQAEALVKNLQEQLLEEQRRRDTDNKAWEVKSRANIDEISRLREGLATLEAGLQESQSESMTRISTLQARLTASERQEEVLVRRNEASEAEIERLREDARKRSATVQELEKRVVESGTRQSTAESGQRLAAAELQSALSEKAKIEAEYAASFGEMHSMQARLLKSEQEREASDKAVRDLSENSAGLNQQVLDLQTALRYKVKDLLSAESRLRDIELQVAGLAEVKAEVISLKADNINMQDLLAALDSENKRMTEADLKLREELTRRIEENQRLLYQINDIRIEGSSERASSERALKEQLWQAENALENTKAELERFYALPNPVGVGLGLEEIVDESSKTVKINGIIRGSSADMAGILRVGDEVVGVEGMHAAAMTLDQIRERIAGKRGSRVDLTFRRGESDAEFTITFKRGAWGPEHCVVTPENLDVIDKSSGSPSKGVRAA